MNGGSSDNYGPNADIHEAVQQQSPKPPTPPPANSAISEAVIPAEASTSDPPPPYPSRDRRTRAERARLRRAIQQLSNESGTSGTHIASPTGNSQQLRLVTDPLGASNTQTDSLVPFSPSSDGNETTPLLSPRRRTRRLSHSTVVSTHSIAQTVLSLFGSDDADAESYNDQIEIADEENGEADTSAPTVRRRDAKRYFRPLWRKTYYLPLFHLLVINFFYALAAFVYLFVGTLTGTTLLIALPLGAVLCWLNLAGARAFARGEIALQTYFHGPLLMRPPNPPYPIFSRQHGTTSLEAGQRNPQNQPSFLRDTYTMFTDQTSYQAIFYFLVIKPSITLFLTVALLALVPVAFILVIPAPAVLRAVKRIGVWQANIALEGLLRPQL